MRAKRNNDQYIVLMIESHMSSIQELLDITGFTFGKTLFLIARRAFLKGITSERFRNLRTIWNNSKLIRKTFCISFDENRSKINSI